LKKLREDETLIEKKI
jgi:hypothetical protein